MLFPPASYSYCVCNLILRELSFSFIFYFTLILYRGRAPSMFLSWRHRFFSFSGERVAVSGLGTCLVPFPFLQNFAVFQLFYFFQLFYLFFNFFIFFVFSDHTHYSFGMSLEGYQHRPLWRHLSSFGRVAVSAVGTVLVALPFLHYFAYF